MHDVAHTMPQRSAPRIKIDLNEPKASNKEGKAKIEHVKSNKPGPKATWVPKPK